MKKIHDLIDKLNRDQISKEEYMELLTYIKEDQYRGVIDEALDRDIKDFYSQSEKDEVPEFRTAKRKWLYRIGVAASVLILIAAGIYFLGPNSNKVLSYSTTNGETLNIQLPDESNVTLNANSTLTWSANPEHNIRKVKLSGEAYFDVKHLEGKPFRVYSDDMMVQVLGTTFNVNNRNRKDEVYLEYGMVKLLNLNGKGDSLFLSSGESAYMDQKENAIRKSTNSRFADGSKWKDGVLKFTDLSVKEILDQIEAIYGVKLVLKDPILLERPMDFALPYSNWDIVSAGLGLALGTKMIKKENYYELISIHPLPQ